MFLSCRPFVAITTTKVENKGKLILINFILALAISIPINSLRTSLLHDKGDKEMIPGLCTYLVEFALQLKKTLENLSEGTVDEGCSTSDLK